MCTPSKSHIGILCGHQSTGPNVVGADNFPLLRRSVMRHPCPNQNLTVFEKSIGSRHAPLSSTPTPYTPNGGIPIMSPHHHQPPPPSPEIGTQRAHLCMEVWTGLGGGGVVEASVTLHSYVAGENILGLGPVYATQ